MSTINVTTVQSANGSTDLTLASGNTSAGDIVIPATGGMVLAANSTVNTMVIAGSNVGIGTASPAALLDVNGTGRFTGTVSVSLDNTTGGGIILSDDGDIVDLNDGFASMRFSNGVRIFSGNKTGSSVITLSSSGTISDSTATLRPLVRMTPQSNTAVTLITFPNIPSWARRITVTFYGLSLSGSDRLLVRLGSGGVTTNTGYTSYTSEGQTSTAGFILGGASASDVRYGTMTILNHTDNQWMHTSITSSTTSNEYRSFGFINLAGTLDIVGFTRTGTNTFDAGSVNVFYE